MASSVTTFDSLYDELTKQLRLSGNVKNISDEFSGLKTDQSRAAFTMNLKHVKDVIKVPDLGASKSNIDALKFKDLGNKQFQKGDYHEAAKLYTKSIAHAPLQNDVNTLSISYANRSAALYHMGLHNDALLDIDRATANSYPEEMRYKLLERKAKCLRQIGNYSCAADFFKEALSVLPASNLGSNKRDALQKDLSSQLSECLKNTIDTSVRDLKVSEDVDNSSNTGNGGNIQDRPEHLRQTHEVFTSLSAACDVAYTENKGRFIVSKRNLKPGETILVEKPYASVLLLDHTLSHCHHCFKRIVAPIPSAVSCLAVFCDETCRKAATYHEYEWPSLEVIAKSRVGKFGYLALRTITKYGPEFLRKFKMELHKGQFEVESKKLQGCGTNGKYEASEFNAIYNLVTHACDRTVQDLFRRSVLAVFLLKCIEKGTFFSNLTKDEVSFREFVAGLLLSHLQAFPCNAHEISELDLKKNDIAASVAVEIGAGIYSTLSLFNHSCDPVVNRNFYGDMCVVRTIKPVKKGEEISDNYGAVYAVHSLAERQEKLRPQYYFQCSCQACEENWPMYPEINYQKRIWKCSNCKAPLPLVNGDTRFVHCSACNMQENIDGKTRALESSEKNYELAFNKLLKGNIQEALPVFLVHLQILDKLLCRPWRDFNNCQEAIKQCFSILGNHTCA